MFPLWGGRQRVPEGWERRAGGSFLGDGVSPGHRELGIFRERYRGTEGMWGGEEELGGPLREEAPSGTRP